MEKNCRAHREAWIVTHGPLHIPPPPWGYAGQSPSSGAIQIDFVWLAGSLPWAGMG